MQLEKVQYTTTPGAFGLLSRFFIVLFKDARAYAFMMMTRPQAVSYGLTDSPAGLAACEQPQLFTEELRIAFRSLR